MVNNIIFAVVFLVFSISETIAQCPTSDIEHFSLRLGSTLVYKHSNHGLVYYDTVSVIDQVLDGNQVYYITKRIDKIYEKRIWMQDGIILEGTYLLNNKMTIDEEVFGAYFDPEDQFKVTLKDSVVYVGEVDLNILNNNCQFQDTHQYQVYSRGYDGWQLSKVIYYHMKVGVIKEASLFETECVCELIQYVY